MADGLRLTQLTRKLEYSAKADLFYTVSSTGTGISRSYRVTLDNIGKGIKFNVLKPDFDKIASNWTTTNTYSGNWQNVYTTTNACSSNWQSVYTNSNTYSGFWQSNYTTVNACSAKWDTAYQVATNVYSTTNACSAKWDNPLERVYPVGSIHMSVCQCNPAFYAYPFPGCWIAFGQGRVLIGAGTGTDINNCSQTYASGQCGGEYTHQLTTSEMPRHNHTICGNNLNDSCADCGVFKTIIDDDWKGPSYSTTDIQSTGGNQPHNNVQPYIGVYMWNRCA